MNVSLVVASYEVCFVNEICWLNLVLTKSQVGNCDTAGLLWVIWEVALCILFCFVTDDLDGLLVGTNCTVGTKTPELTSNCASRLCCDVHCRQWAVVYVVNDTDCEVILCLLSLKVVVYCNNLSRCCVVGTKTISSCINFRSVVNVEVKVSYVEIKWVAFSTRLFCSVENSNLLGCLRHSLQEVLCWPRSVKSYFYETNFFALLFENVDCLFYCFADWTHCYDYIFSISCSNVIEELVLSACEFADFLHVLFSDSRYCIVEGLTCFTSLEEDVRVLSCTSYNRVLRIKSSCSEVFNSFFVYEFSKIFVVDYFDLLYFVWSSESIEEVQEWNSSFNSSKVCNSTKVHYFLNWTWAQQSEACLTASHYVWVVTENTKSVSSECSCRYVEYAGQEFAGDLVHVRDHKKQTLRSCVCSRKSTCLQWSVNGTCSTCFWLHLNYLDLLSENVFVSMCSHIIYDLSHRWRRRDGIDGSYISKRIWNISGCCVTIHCLHDFVLQMINWNRK